MRWIVLALILLPSPALSAIPLEVLAHFKWYEKEYQPDVIKKMGHTIQERRATLAAAKQGNVILISTSRRRLYIRPVPHPSIAILREEIQCRI